MTYNKAFAARFWAKVDMSGGPDACWPWTGGLFPNGYGRLRVGKRRGLAHKVAHELTNGHIPHPLKACHECDNRPCCNPGHIWAGTQKANMEDMLQKGRGNWRRGPSHPKYKFTDDQIAAAIASERSIGNIATSRKLGISSAYLSGLVHGTQRRGILGVSTVIGSGDPTRPV